ncbi:MAG: winged helix-turn-helix transcriptional regulator [Halieaceae bacterium]|jgi:hypothetical protein|nr:winged helix-turn-helix transcriptional regulator [Halieaceae bacterium]
MANRMKVKPEELLTFIEEHPGCTKSELARFAGVTTPTIDYHTKKMLKAGTIESKRVGGKTQLHRNNFDGGAGSTQSTATKGEIPQFAPPVASTQTKARSMGSSIRAAFMQAVPNEAAMQILEQMLPGIVEQGLKFADLPPGWHCALCSDAELLAALRHHVDQEDFLQAMLTAGAILVRSQLVPQQVTTVDAPRVVRATPGSERAPDGDSGSGTAGQHKENPDEQSSPATGATETRKQEPAGDDSQGTTNGDPDKGEDETGADDNPGKSGISAGLSFLHRGKRSPEEIAEALKRGRKVTHQKGV